MQALFTPARPSPRAALSDGATRATLAVHSSALSRALWGIDSAERAVREARAAHNGAAMREAIKRRAAAYAQARDTLARYE